MLFRSTACTTVACRADQRRSSDRIYNQRSWLIYTSVRDVSPKRRSARAAHWPMELAIPVLCGSLSYIVSETFGWKGDLNKKFYQAKPFYIVIIISLIVGLLINYIGLSPIKALLYTAILYGLTSPILIAIVLHIANNKKIMKGNTNSKISNFLGFLTLLLMTLAGIALIWFQF